MSLTPIDLVKSFMNNGGNPQKLIQKAVTPQNSNSMINNLLVMAKKGDEKGIENFARNFMKERGRDFDKEFKEFKNNFK